MAGDHDPEATPALSIGAVIGGSESASRTWEAAVKGLARQVAEARQGASSPLSVNVVYQIPGKYLQPEFSGVRTGRFSAKKRHLLVQVALPEEVPADAEGYVLARLKDAVELAQDYAHKRRVTGESLDGLFGLIDSLGPGS